MFGVTEEPYLVFAANAFALLGLRALFFLVRGLLDRLVYLSTGLAVVLAFIGVKLVLHWGHTLSDAVPEVPTLPSLGVIAVIYRWRSAPHGTWLGSGGPPKAGRGAAPECKASAAATHSGVDGRSFGPSVPSRVTRRNTYSGSCCVS